MSLKYLEPLTPRGFGVRGSGLLFGSARSTATEKRNRSVLLPSVSGFGFPLLLKLTEVSLLLLDVPLFEKQRESAVGNDLAKSTSEPWW